MRIGRDYWDQAQRPAEFYTAGLSKLRKACSARGIRLTVFGNSDAADVTLNFSDVISLLGGERFDRMERLRCTYPAGAYTSRTSTWYCAVQHLKYALLQKVIQSDEESADFLWVDAGASSHGWCDVDTVLDGHKRGMGEVTAITASWRKGWEGANLARSEVTHPGWAPAGTIVGGSRSCVRDFCALYFKELDSLLLLDAFGTDEDVMVITHAKYHIPKIAEHMGEFYKMNTLIFNNYAPTGRRKFFWHIAFINHWRDIVLQQLDFLRKVGFSGDLTVGAAGPGASNFEDLKVMLEGSGLACRVVYHGPSMAGYEFPTMLLLEQACRSGEAEEVVYMHAKGVSKPGCSHRMAWRMLHMIELLGRHDDPNLLKGYDVACALLAPSGGWLPPHNKNVWIADGNFWAATAAHICNLPDLTTTYNETNKHPELPHQWVGYTKYFRARRLESSEQKFLWKHCSHSSEAFFDSRRPLVNYTLRIAAAASFEKFEPLKPADFTITECLAMFTNVACDLGCDKITAHHYHTAYEDVMSHLKNTRSSLLEIGVASGYSLYAWKLFLGSDATVTGVDINPAFRHDIPGVQVVIADATTQAFADTLGDCSLDVVIDDGSHRPGDIVKSFEVLYPKVKPGGRYVVEDIGDLSWVAQSVFAAHDYRIVDLRKESRVGDSVMLVVRKPCPHEVPPLPAELRYRRLCEERTDINEHLPTLFNLATQCRTVTELGVCHAVSTSAFVAARPEQLRCCDIVRQSEVDTVAKQAADAGIQFSFELGDSRQIEARACDLLFIDSRHTRDQLAAELELHGPLVARWIVLHDTVTFGERGEDGGEGLLPAVREFLARHPWRIAKEYTNNNGLMVLEPLAIA